MQTGLLNARNGLISNWCSLYQQIQDSSSTIQLPALNILPRYFLHISGHQTAWVVCQRAVAIVPVWQGWNDPFKVDPGCYSICLFSQYLLQQTVALERRRTSFMTNSPLVCRNKSFDIEVVADDVNVQVGKCSASDACLGGRCTFPHSPWGDGDRLL